MQVFWAILVFHDQAQNQALQGVIQRQDSFSKGMKDQAFEDDMKILREQGALMKSPGTLQLPDLSRRISRSKRRPKAHKHMQKYSRSI